MQWLKFGKFELIHMGTKRFTLHTTFTAFCRKFS